MAWSLEGRGSSLANEYGGCMAYRPGDRQIVPDASDIAGAAARPTRRATRSRPAVGPKVLIVTPRFGPLLGGMERECELLAREYVVQGYRPVVITEQLGTSAPAQEICGGAEIHRVPSSPSRSAFNQLRAALGIARSTLATRHDVSFCVVRTFTLPAVVIGLLKRLRLLDFPTMVTAETGGVADDIVALSERRFAGILTYLVRGNDLFNGICTDNVEHLAGLGYPPARITFIPNGVNTCGYEHALPPTSVQRFLFLGRIDRRKGVVDLIAAFAEADVEGTSLTIIGEGPDEPLVHAAIASSRSNVQIKLLERVPYDEVDGVLSSHDCLVLPSYSEGLPLTVLEAVVQKRAIISTNVGDLSLLLGDNARCVAPGDVKALADAIKSAAEETPRFDYGEIVARMDIRQTARQIADALLDLTSRR